jgi:hypothetical protein
MSAAGLPVVAAMRQRAAMGATICISLLRSPHPHLFQM